MHAYTWRLKSPINIPTSKPVAAYIFHLFPLHCLNDTYLDSDKNVSSDFISLFIQVHGPFLFETVVAFSPLSLQGQMCICDLSRVYRVSFDIEAWTANDTSAGNRALVYIYPDFPGACVGVYRYRDIIWIER